MAIRTTRWMTALVAVTMLLGAAVAYAAGAQQPAVAEAKPTLRVLLPPFSDDPNTRFEAENIERITGYKVDYEAISSERPADQLNLIVASREPYDVINVITAGGSTFMKDIILNFVRQGAVRELDPLIERYGANVGTAPSEFTRELWKVDGRTYVLPVRLPVDYVSALHLYRHDWLDRVGLPVPQTLDQFVAVLRAFRTQITNAEGRNPVAYTFVDPMALQGLLGAFGIENPWLERDGRLVPREETQGFRDYLAFMRNLYAEGLIDREFPANTGTTVTEKFVNSNAGIISVGSFSGGTIVDNLMRLSPDARVEVLPPLSGSDGRRSARIFSGYDYLAFIPVAARNPEHAMRWMDAKLEPGNFLEVALGEPGVHHTFDGNAYMPILPIFQEQMGAASNFLTGTREADYARYWPARLRRLPEMHRTFTTMNRLAEPYNEIDVTGFAVGVQTYVANDTRLRTMTRDFAIQVIAGAEPLSAIDGFVQRWRAEGGTESAADINQWYAETFARLRPLLDK